MIIRVAYSAVPGGLSHRCRTVGLSKFRANRLAGAGGHRLFAGYAKSSRKPTQHVASAYPEGLKKFTQLVSGELVTI